MSTEQHVTSLELAKKLKNAGYPQQEAEFWWAVCEWGVDKSGCNTY